MELDFNLTPTLITDTSVTFDVVICREFGETLTVSTERGDDDTEALAILLEGLRALQWHGTIVHQARTDATKLLLQRYVAERQVA